MSCYGRVTPRRHTVDGGGLYGSGNIRDLIDFSDSDRTEQANNTTTFRKSQIDNVYKQYKFNTGVYDTVHEEESEATAPSQSRQQGGYVIPSSYVMISQTSLRDTGILRHSQNSDAASNSMRSYDISSSNQSLAAGGGSSRNSAAQQRRLSVESCTSGISFQSRASSVSSRSSTVQQQRRLSVESSNSSGMPCSKSSGIYGTSNRRRLSISTTGTSCESRADSQVDEYGRTSFYSDTTASSSVASSFQAPGGNSTRVLPKAVTSRSSVAQGRRRLSIESSNLGLSSQSRGTRSSAVQGRRLSVDSNSSGKMSYQSRSSKQSHQATTSISSVSRRLTVDNSDLSMSSSISNGTKSYQQLYNSVRTGGTSGANQENGQYYPYQIDFNVMNQGQSIPGSKRAIHIRFGFASTIALSRGMTGLDCRGEEHDIMAAWSITGGKRAVLMDGKEIQYSVGNSNASRRADIFEASWRMGGHVYQLKLYAYPPSTGSPEKRDPKWRQYSLIIDGKSYFDLPFVHDLGHTAYCNLNLPSLSVHCNDSVSISGFTTGSSTAGAIITNTKEDIQARINMQRSLISARKNQESHNKCKNRSPTPSSVGTSATSGTSSNSIGTMGLENMGINESICSVAHSSVLSELDQSGYSTDVDNRTLHQSNTSKSSKANEDISIMPSPGVNKFAFF